MFLGRASDLLQMMAKDALFFLQFDSLSVNISLSHPWNFPDLCFSPSQFFTDQERSPLREASSDQTSASAAYFVPGRQEHKMDAPILSASWNRSVSPPRSMEMHSTYAPQRLGRHNIGFVEMPICCALAFKSKGFL